jgi:hypothetical protein
MSDKLNIKKFFTKLDAVSSRCKFCTLFKHYSNTINPSLIILEGNIKWRYTIHTDELTIKKKIQDS